MAEQSQAEKLAEQVWLNVHKDKQIGGSPISRHASDEICEMEKWVIEAITKATEGLRAENERLKKEFFDHRQYTIELSRKNADYISSVKTERDQAQAQVAALVETVRFAHTCMTTIMGNPPAELTNALKDTQATADAYEAKVREAAIRECLEAVHEKQANGFPQGGDIESGMLMAFGDAREAMESLLPAKNWNCPECLVVQPSDSVEHTDASVICQECGYVKPAKKDGE